MGNSVKYSIASEQFALKIGNFYYGTGDVAKGPTSETDYWITYVPPLGGYSIYLEKASSGPSIYAPVNSYFLPQFVNYFFYQNFTTAEECFTFLRINNRFVVNRNIESVITSGLTLMLDPSFLPSYPVGSDVFYDVSLNAYTGSNVNLVYEPNNYGAVIFNGTSAYVESIAASSSFSFIQNSGVFTISTWVKPTALDTELYIMGNNGGVTTSKGFRLGKDGSNNLIFQITKGVSGEYVVDVTGTSFFTDTSWVNITIVGNGTTCQLYKNGVAFGEPVDMNAFSTGDSAATLNLGKVASTSSQYWNGAISRTLIYNVAFTETDITNTYNMDVNVFNYSAVSDQSRNVLGIQNGDFLVLQEVLE